jgi:Co/Zn/Cd efflux system component
MRKHDPRRSYVHANRFGALMVRHDKEGVESSKEKIVHVHYSQDLFGSVVNLVTSLVIFTTALLDLCFDYTQCLITDGVTLR